MRAVTWLLPTSLVLVTSGATGEETRTIDHSRLRLSDAVPSVPAAMADIDLGPAPPPGGARLVGRDEMIVAIRRAGLYANTTRLPAVVRVTSASRRIPSAELAALAAAAIAKSLRPGVALRAVEGAPDIVVAPRAEVRGAAISAVPYHK